MYSRNRFIECVEEEKIKQLIDENQRVDENARHHEGIYWEKNYTTMRKK